MTVVEPREPHLLRFFCACKYPLGLWLRGCIRWCARPCYSQSVIASDGVIIIPKACNDGNGAR